MKLKKGITGIWNVKDALVKSESDVSSFRRSLFPLEYTGSLVYKITGFTDEDSCKNFSRLSLSNVTKKQDIDILINSMHPYYCGVLPGTIHAFIDLPGEIIACADPQFEYLAPVKLTSRFNETDLAELSESELKEIKSWGAKTYGDILFNTWD